MKTRDLLGVCLLALLWSPTFLIIRIGVHDIPPITLTWMRLVVASLFLLGWCFIQKRPLRPYLRDWKKIFIAGLLNNVIAFTCCALGEVYADSSTAGIIEGSVSLYTLVISVVVLGQRKLNARQVAGAVLGFAGLMIILMPTVSHEGHGIGLGVLMLNMMAISFASGFLYTERTLDHVPPLPAATLQVVAATLLLTPISALYDQPWHSATLTWTLSGYMVALGVFGTALPWIVYFRLVKKIGASYVAFATLLCPVIVILWGYVFLHEPLTWYKLLGAGVTFASVMLVGPTADLVLKWIKARA